VVLPLAAGIHGIAMNFSAEKASRKWPCAGWACGERPVTVAAILLMLCGQALPAAAARKSGAWSLEAGSEQYAPLARAIIGGLAMSVVVTVFIVPAAYLWIHRREQQAPAGQV